jgi:hypothetical protein
VYAGIYIGGTKPYRRNKNMAWKAEEVLSENLQEYLNEITLEKFEVYGIYPVTHRIKIRGVSSAQSKIVNAFMIVSRKG